MMKISLVFSNIRNSRERERQIMMDLVAGAQRKMPQSY